MDQTLHRLGILLIEAIPTLLFFIILNHYLKRVLFQPLARIVEERKKATEGVRELAERAFQEADKKTSEFEHALQIARAQIHQEHEALRRKWAEEQAAELAKARAEADRRIEHARHEIAEQIEHAQAQLNTHIESLSEQIASSLLRRRVA